MTLNGVIALILLYFTEFGSFAGLLRHNTVVEDCLHFCLPLLAKTDPPCSAVSLRQLSYLLPQSFNHATQSAACTVADLATGEARGLLLSDSGVQAGTLQ